MQRRSRLVLGSLAMLGLISTACGDDTDDRSDGTGGESSGGMATGGNSDSGGSSSGGTTGTGGSGTGGSSSGGTTGTGGSGTGGGTGGSAAGGNPNTGGQSAGGSGGTNTGGSDTGGDNMGGMGGEMGGAPGADCDQLTTLPNPPNVRARVDDQDWAANDFDDVTLDRGECDELLVSAEWPHEDNWQELHPADPNFEANVNFELEFPFTTPADLTGKRLNLTIKLVTDGRGPNAENGGYMIYLGATDSMGYNESATPYVMGMANMPEYFGAMFNADEEVTLSYTIPSDQADFDQDSIYKVFVRITNQYWGDGTSPVFDYTTTDFEITDFSISDVN